MDEIQKATIYTFAKLIEILLTGDIKPAAYSLMFARIFHLSATIANSENPGGAETLHESQYLGEPWTTIGSLQSDADLYYNDLHCYNPEKDERPQFTEKDLKENAAIALEKIHSFYLTEDVV